MKFDLTRESWIPVIDGDGAEREVGLRELFARAHELRDIRDAMPTVEFGLYRLATAILYDLLLVRGGGGSLRRARYTILGAGCLDVSAVDAYFDSLPGRFDLFGETPFLQTAGMDDIEAKPVATLAQPVPSGTNANHFQHGQETDFAVCPAAAARLLTTLAPFTTEGGRGLSPSVNGAPPWYVLVLGKNVFETLCLNMYVGPNQSAHGAGPVAWRNLSPPGTQRNSTSYAEALTWRPRRIQLVPGPGGVCSLTGCSADLLVSSMRFASGDSWDASPRWRDPSVAYRTTKNGTSPLRPTEGRPLFRDLAPIALLRQSADSAGTIYDRPMVIDQYQRTVDDGAIPRDRDLQLVLYGLRVSQKSKLFEWIRVQLPGISYGEVHDQRTGAKALELITRAQTGANSLALAIRKLATDRQDREANQLGSLIAFAQRQYWVALEDPYLAFVRDVAKAFHDEAGDEAVGELTLAFLERARREAFRAFDAAAEPFDATGRSLEKLTGARATLERRLGDMVAGTSPQPGAKKGRNANA